MRELIVKRALSPYITVPNPGTYQCIFVTGTCRRVLDGMSTDPTLQELLDLQSDGEFDMSQLDPGPGPSGSSVACGNPQETLPTPAGKRKKSSAKTAVSRDEFCSLQSQMASMAEAMETLQSTILSSLEEGRPAKKPKTDQTVSSSDESVSTAKVIDDLLKPSNDEASAEVLTAIEQFYSTDDAGEKIND